MIAYTLLCGYSPWRAEDKSELERETTKGRLTFHERFWKNVSKQGQYFQLHPHSLPFWTLYESALDSGLRVVDQTLILYSQRLYPCLGSGRSEKAPISHRSAATPCKSAPCACSTG